MAFSKVPGPWQLDMHGTVWGEELEEFSLGQGAEIGTLLIRAAHI